MCREVQAHILIPAARVPVFACCHTLTCLRVRVLALRLEQVPLEQAPLNKAIRRGGTADACGVCARVVAQPALATPP